MKIQPILLFIVSIIVGYLLIGQNLQAKLFYVDDHEIPYYLNGKDRMGLPEIPAALQKTEFYSFGKGARFRPVYSLFRVSETVLWGNNPYLWYLARFCIFVSSFFLFWILLKRYVGIVIGFLILMYTLTFPYWTDIWARLGPGEIYCVPALALFLWSYINIIEQKRTLILNWIILLTSTVVMIGSKETFAFLLIFIFFLDAYLLKTKRLHKIEIIFSLLTFLSNGLILLGVGIYIYKTNVDFYMNNVGILTRLFMMSRDILDHGLRVWNRFFPYDALGILVLCVVAFVITPHIYTLTRSSKEKLKQGTIELMWTLLLMVITVLTQIYFYNGIWPTRMRYDFPGMLALPVIFFAIYRFIRLFVSLLKKQLIDQLIPYIFAILLLVYISFIGYKPLIVASESNVTRTIEFTGRLEQIVKDLNENTLLPIVFTSCSAGDYEFVTSLQRFLAPHLNNRQVYLEFIPNKEVNISDLDTYLANSLMTRSLQGDQLFTPIAQKSSTNNCYAINFSCEKVSCIKSMSLVQPWCISVTNSKYTSPYRMKLINSSCVL